MQNEKKNNEKIGTSFQTCEITWDSRSENFRRLDFEELKKKNIEEKFKDYGRSDNLEISIHHNLLATK